MWRQSGSDFRGLLRFAGNGRFLLLWRSAPTAPRPEAYDPRTLACLGGAAGLPEGTCDYVESGSGKHAVILLNDKVLAFWDPAGHRTRAKLDEKIEDYKVAFSPDESLAAVATSTWHGQEDRLRVWRTDTGQLVREVRGFGPASSRHRAEGLQWTPDARFIFAASAAGSDEYAVGVWDAKSGRLRGALQTGLCRPIGGVFLLPDGRHLAVSGYDPRPPRSVIIRFWDFAEALKQVHEFDRAPNRAEENDDGRDKASAHAPDAIRAAINPRTG